MVPRLERLALICKHIFSRNVLPDAPSACSLSFLSVQVCSIYADLRISLREVREGQRDLGPLKRLERDKMPTMRLAKAFQETVSICVINRQRSGSVVLHGQAEFMRDVWHRKAAFPLTRYFHWAHDIPAARSCRGKKAPSHQCSLRFLAAAHYHALIFLSTILPPRVSLCFSASLLFNQFVLA